MKLSQILKLAGSILGVIVALTIILPAITSHKIAVVILVLCAVAYFAGVYFQKKGK
jgi:uncharacterized membrane protein